MQRIRKRLTYANVISTLALFLVLTGGAAYAAKKIGSHELRGGAVTTAKIKRNAVTRSKIKAEAISTAKIAKGAITNARLAEGSVSLEKPFFSQLHSNILLVISLQTQTLGCKNPL